MVLILLDTATWRGRYWAHDVLASRSEVRNENGRVKEAHAITNSLCARKVIQIDLPK